VSVLIGRTVDGRYRVVRKLGTGGMGEVFVARQMSLRREVALKILKPALVANGELVARFQREALTAARVRHDNVVDIHDCGTCAATGVHYIAMELLAGETLHQRMKRGALGLFEANDIVRQLVAGLDAGHALGIFHRDVKPKNVMLVPGASASEVRVKLLDFGIVRDVDVDAMLTPPTGFLGTPRYAAPEALDDMRASDARSDLYSVGAIWFQMLTGAHPFAAVGPIRTYDDVDRLKAARAPAASSLVPVPVDVEAAIARLLDPDPALRPTARELLAMFANKAAFARARTDPRAIVVERGGRRVLENQWLTVDIFDDDGLVRVARKPVRLEADDIERAYENVGTTPAHIDFARYAVLLDARAVPHRVDTDDYGLRLAATLLAVGVQRFARGAILVRKSEVVERNRQRFGATGERVTFDDEAEALAFLLRS
jgi:serine/threonine protein kinase